MMKKISLLTIVMMAMLMGCSDSNQDDQQTRVIPGHWGQLSQLELLAPTPMFLLFTRPEDTYRVCVASHLIEEHPHIMTEVDASIKIWGRYIGRPVQTSVVQAPIPAPTATEHPDVTFKNYTNACPEADVVVGYANINSIGQTSIRYSYFTNGDGLHVPRQGRRVMYLQNPAFKNATWRSYYHQRDDLVPDTEELVATLMERAHYQLEEEPNHFSTLVVLVHEFGHVWGLCDMYPLPGGHTNCDPVWSKKDEAGNILLVPEAKMAAAGWKNPLFLHDDDIDGIRTLAKRDRFQSLWPNQDYFPEVAPAQEANFLFKFKNTQLQGNSLLFNFALYSPNAVVLNITLNSDRGALRYQPMRLPGPIDTNQYGLNLGFPAGVTVNSLHVVISDEQGNQLAEVNTL